MRRVVAISLMALFSFSLISPAMFAQDSDSKLPACCRRGGKHHCGMEASLLDPSSGPSLQAAQCSFFPTMQALSASPFAGPPGAFQAVLSEPCAQLASPVRTEALSLSSYSRAGQKRGPPSLLS